jgi:hypothetical protein
LVSRHDLALVILAVGSVAILAVAPIVTRARPTPPPPSPPPPPVTPPPAIPPAEELTFPESVLKAFRDYGGYAIVFISREPSDAQLNLFRQLLLHINISTRGLCVLGGGWPTPVLSKVTGVVVGRAWTVYASFSPTTREGCKRLIRGAIESAFAGTYDYVIEF